MIATGNHNFERFAALCNTLSGEPRRLRRWRAASSRPYPAFLIFERLHIGTRPVGEALSLPNPTQLRGSVNVEWLRRWRAATSRPYRCGESRGYIPFIPRHSLSFAFAQQLPQRGSQGHFVPAGGYEPPLLVRWKPGMQRGRTPYAECALVTAAPSCSADIHFNRRK